MKPLSVFVQLGLFMITFNSVAAKILTFSNNNKVKTTEKDIHVMGSLEPPSFTTIVATYFNFKSKHPSSHYFVWLETFLTSVTSPLVMLIDSKSYLLFKEFRSNPAKRTIFIVYDSIWDILEEFESARNQSYLENYKEKQHAKDSEQFHVPELYAIWNLKSYYLHKVSKQNPYGSKFFIYSDAGAWRGTKLEIWPDESLVRQVANVVGDSILLAQINTKHPQNPAYTDSIEGTFFAGTAAAIDDWQSAFYYTHDKMFNNGWFIGKDQYIMNIVAYNVFHWEPEGALKNNVSVLLSYRAECGDKWFYFIIFFASSEVYEKACGNKPVGMNRLSLIDTSGKYL